jgi:hypothetical protein
MSNLESLFFWIDIFGKKWVRFDVGHLHFYVSPVFLVFPKGLSRQIVPCFSLSFGLEFLSIGPLPGVVGVPLSESLA